MTLRPIAPLRRRLDGVRVRVPASKSVANRELVLSALAAGTSRLQLGSLDPGDDVRAMREALVRLGYGVEQDDQGTITLKGGAGTVPAPAAAIDAGDAGTVARFATALAALGSGPTTIDGSPQLRTRPLAPLLAALRDLGATVDGERLPVTVSGPAHGGAVEVPGSHSSQFASALLLVAPALREGLRLQIKGPLVSAPFVELTIAALAARSVAVERTSPYAYAVAPQVVKARDIRIPGDVTAATYPTAAAAILGGEVTVENVDARERSGTQGDVRFFALLEQMGCSVARRGGSVTVRRSGTLFGIVADLRDCSDVFPTLAAVAACASTPSELLGVAHTRLQESDRIAAVAAGLRALGALVTESADGLRIVPRPLHAGAVDAAGDHRIAMAFSILGLEVPGVAIEGSEVVAKTFPDFYRMLKDLAR